MGVASVFDTGCPFPTFGIVKPAVTNTRVDMSPYGQSVFADAVDAGSHGAERVLRGKDTGIDLIHGDVFDGGQLEIAAFICRFVVLAAAKEQYCAYNR